MHTILEVIAMTWVVIAGGFLLIAKLSGISPFFQVLLKVGTVLAMVYFLLDILKIAY